MIDFRQKAILFAQKAAEAGKVAAEKTLETAQKIAADERVQQAAKSAVDIGKKTAETAGEKLRTAAADERVRTVCERATEVGITAAQAGERGCAYVKERLEERLAKERAREEEEAAAASQQKAEPMPQSEPEPESAPESSAGQNPVKPARRRRARAADAENSEK